MSTHHREERLNEIIKRELADIILKEFNNHVESMITVVDVDVEKDLSRAKVIVAIFPTDLANETLVNLIRAKGFFRHRISERHQNKSMPDLLFQLETVK